MSLRRISIQGQAALWFLATLWACTSADRSLHVTPTAAPQVAATPSPSAPAAESSPATSKSADAARVSAPISPVAAAQAQTSAASAQNAAVEPVPQTPVPQSPRLPVVEDLGPNYFELLSAESESGPDSTRAGRTSAALVAFGYSERAKLRDERIERDGPLAAVVRLTRHPTTESADRYAAAAATAESLNLPAAGDVPSLAGLTAAMTGDSLTSYELAPGFTATRTLQTGWFAALDGSRANAALEIWIVQRARTVLTVVLAWGNHVTDGWGHMLIQQLAQAFPERDVPHAP